MWARSTSRSAARSACWWACSCGASTRLADELRAADAELADAAAREERHRIARDVHDLVAHSLTVVVLHVGGARRVLRSDPDAAEAALVEAERVSRESLDAIRGAVGMLRDDDEPEVGIAWTSSDSSPRIARPACRSS